MIAFTGRSGLMHWRPSLIAYGIFAVAAFRVLYAYSVWVNGAGVTSSLLYTAPLLVAVFAPLIIGEWPSPLDIVLAGVAVAGAYVASNPSLNVSSIWGFLIGIGLGCVYAVTIVAIKHFYSRGYSRDELLVQPTLAAVPVLFLTALITGDPMPTSPRGYASLAWAGIVCMAIGLIIYLEGMKAVKALHASVVATLEPVSSIILAHVLLGERLAPIQLLGIAAILGSSVLIATRAHAKHGS